MTLFPRFRQYALLCASVLLLSFGLAARADEVQDAYKLYKQKQFDQASEKVNGILANKPKDAKARFLKGLIVMDQGKMDDAIGIFQALTEDFPDQAEPYNNLGFLYAMRGQYEKARTAMEMAIQLQPTYPVAHENLGDIYAKMASKEYERAVQLDPNNSSPQAKLATIKQLFPKTAARAQTVTIPAASAPAAAPVTKSPAKP